VNSKQHVYTMAHAGSRSVSDVA